MSTKLFCSEVCLETSEPLVGTALRVDVWIMIEYRRAWQAKALANNTFAQATNDWIEQSIASFATRGLIARPQFIRRPERSDGITLFVAQSGRLGGLTLENEKALQQLDLLNTEIPEVAGPQYFVCTNAKRDLCCAKFGRPTYAALHKLIPNRVWQTTHVGGHRYAPNILTLPDANMYGRVMVDDVQDFLAETENQQIARKFLRGNTGYSKLAQVAEHSLASQDIQDGEATPFRLLREEQDSATFATTAGAKTITVTPSTRGITILPSCGKPEETVYPLTPQLTPQTKSPDTPS
jgi:hypothetical protein